MEFHVDTIGRNRLANIVGVTPFVPLIASSNYTYDAIGNLTNDSGEGISADWNNAGKPTRISTPATRITFTYSPLGQRQSKTVSLGNYSDFYLHDATGNIMAIYRHTGDTLKLIEKPIYGSSRLGVVNQNITFRNGGTLFRKDTFSVGLKNYELTDHLGNVTATFRDRKYDNNLDITSFTDYYPFGFPMPNRNNNLAGYRFGFNGQEADNEVYGDKQSYGFEFRNYDARLGRFWSVDPLNTQYPELSPYGFVANSPIMLIDPNGAKISDHTDEYGNIIVHYDDGDNSVYLHKTGTTKEQIDQQRTTNNNTGGNGQKLGELGGRIDMYVIFENKLKQSANEAKDMDIIDYYNAVKTNARWDSKKNKNTIWGVAWAYDQDNSTNTTFSSSRFSGLNAADVGNYHAGYTGGFTSIPEYILLKGAGAAETYKSFNEGRKWEGAKRIFELINPFSLRSGDRERDYFWNKVGMDAARNAIKRK